MWWSNMSTQRKIIIGLVLFLSVLILWYQMKLRAIISKLPSNTDEAQNMKKQWELATQTAGAEPIFNTAITPHITGKPKNQKGVWSPPPNQEGFGLFTSKETDLANELAKVSTPFSGKGSIQSYSVKIMGDYPIKDFLVKAAYNAACTGNYMNSEMIKHVLSRGCRFLDFQLYYDTDAQTVMVSSFMSDNVTKTVKSDLPLGDALKTIGQFGFSGPSQNLADPLCLQFRFNLSNQYGVSQYADEMKTMVATLLETRLQDRFYGSKVKLSTPISDLIGKYVIVSDTPISDKKNGKDLVNIDIGRGSFPRFTSKDVDNYMSNYLVIDPATKKSNTTMIKFVEPIAGDTANLPATRIMNQYSSQVVEQMYYVLDRNLTEYETMYYNFGTAFVPLYMAKEYFANLK